MHYVVLLDHDHLGNNLFLKSFAQSISRQKNAKGIILHGDSIYTDLIIQTGVMREDARFRSTREINTRLVGLLADEGIPAIGINGYQKEIVSYNSEDEEIKLNKPFFDGIPGQTFLVLSNLIKHDKEEVPQPYPLIHLAEILQKELELDGIFAFKNSEEEEVIIKNDLPERLYWNNLDENFKKKYLPDELRETRCSFNLVTSRSFMHITDNNKFTNIIYQ